MRRWPRRDGGVFISHRFRKSWRVEARGGHAPGKDVAEGSA